MKSDKQFFSLFQACPDLLGLLMHADPQQKYRFSSPTLKAIERRVDGCLEPVSGQGPRYIVEIDMWKNERAYHSVGAAMGMMGLNEDGGPVLGRILFRNKDVDMQTEPWAEWAKLGQNGFRVYYLDEEFQKLQRDDPDNLLIPILRPFVVQDREDLKQNAKKDYHRIQEADLPEPVKDKVTKVFKDWFFQIFNDLSEEEMRDMLTFAPLEETRVYRDLKAKGLKEGMEKGMEKGLKKGLKEGIERGEKRGLVLGKLEQIQELFDEGILSESVFLQKTSELKAELENLNQTMTAT